MTNLQLIDKSDLETWKEEILAGVLKAIGTIKTPPAEPRDSLIDELDGYVILKFALDKMCITKRQWDYTYKHQIQHKTYGNVTWVKVQSILDFYERDNIKPPKGK